MLAFIVMFLTARIKVIVIADGTEASGNVGAEEKKSSDFPIEVRSSGAADGIFYFHFTEGIKTENIRAENLYMSEEFHITIGDPDTAMDNLYIEGDTSSIREAGWRQQQGEVQICLKMNAVLEYQVSIEGSRLKIEQKDPHAMYRMLVFVDPAAMSVPEEQGALLKKLAEELVADDEMNQIRIYNTCSEGKEISPEEKARLINDLGADLYIGLGFDTQSQPEVYGISALYNGDYFIPEFGNQELADCLTRNVTEAVSNRGIGLQKTDEQEILKDLKVPAAIVQLGCLNHEEESRLLENTEYIRGLEQGITDTIREVYEAYYE